MPANLPPTYYAAEERLRQTSDPGRKVEILREMLAIMPKHKGTEHLQGDLKRRIAKLQSQSKKKSATSRSSGLDHIPPEGAGQAVLVGRPNAGKSSILSQLTHAESSVAEYPFSTFKPVVGMMPFQDIQIQLVDLPPVSAEYQEPWLFNIIRLADLVLCLIDLSKDAPLDQKTELDMILEEHKIVLRKEGEKRPLGPVAFKSTIVIGSKCDTMRAGGRFEMLQTGLEEEFPVLPLALDDTEQVERFKEMVFSGLQVIRIYTKTPGGRVDLEKPYLLPRGATVLDAAAAIHHDLVEKLNYARIWGHCQFDGQRVEQEHELQDGDIIEIHAR